MHVFERQFKNGRLVVTIDGRTIDLLFTGTDGRVVERRTESASSAEVIGLLSASEGDEFDQSLVADWDFPIGGQDLGPRDIDTGEPPTPWRYSGR